MTLRPLIGALALSLLLVACGGKDDSAAKASAPAGAAAPANGASAPRAALTVTAAAPRCTEENMPSSKLALWTISMRGWS